jgi:hypothetical protein
MRTIVLISIALILSVPAQAQQKPTPAVSGLACFENLAAPEFPPAALQAHVDGSVWATVKVSQQSTIEKIDTEVVSAWSDGPKLLVPPVEKVIRAAKVNPACAGKDVPIVFRYLISGDPEPSPTATSRTLGPNVMWIESRPAGKDPLAGGQ